MWTGNTGVLSLPGSGANPSAQWGTPAAQSTAEGNSVPGQKRRSQEGSILSGHTVHVEASDKF